MQNKIPQTSVGFESLPLRFRNRIHIDSDTGCWLWAGSKKRRKRGAHGQVWFLGKMRTIHRVVFELLIGPVPTGLQLHHKCQVQHCCNPDHLKVLTALAHKQQHHKTHCPRGHELTPENTAICGQRRACRICSRERISRWNKAHPEQRRMWTAQWHKANRAKVNAGKRRRYKEKINGLG